ncbi:hypothetical protein EMIHUDRAFT_367626 [Emiliania huxleyi CCMP1516]|uniref:Sugar phosphate transporter domain-containing protein n=2 Tax=Emiliania huxleyi TaxID=2903 RepID=A0A0D3JML1_EMIH1|nr:hypothetical protein EMIHUDRAFT_367626 [Emiliania huxleyi CCMP1516]EOD24746.1 hypothetical protein EMIHUDRAFT_367626 [Emiliania huxleyi CCMP1516]|eukprot:XP_005777175.1 hypothetical protein EMIHUDRAFT_367626 [Emiliania huxleyi CCMP1516]
MREKQEDAAEVAAAVITYCFCSGGMLVINKIAVSHTPSPALVTLCQFASCTVLVYGGKLTGLLRTDDFEWRKVKYFLIYVLSFSIGTWTNIKVLQDANVETVIVFRSCTPLAVSDHEIARDRTRSHEITRDRPRSHEIARAGLHL